MKSTAWAGCHTGLGVLRTRGEKGYPAEFDGSSSFKGWDVPFLLLFLSFTLVHALTDFKDISLVREPSEYKLWAVGGLEPGPWGSQANSCVRQVLLSEH